MKTLPFCTRFLFAAFGLLYFTFYMAPIYAQDITFHGCGTSGGGHSSGTENIVAACNNSLIDFNSNHNDDMVPQGISRTLKIKTNIVILQRENGSGNFSPSTNQEHKDFLDKIFVKLNEKVTVLQQENCNCSTAPEHYNNIHIEFVPTYIEIEDEFYWNHLNDSESSTWNSADKIYLNGIHQLLLDEGYEPGFDVFLTMNKPFYEGVVIQDLPYDRSLYPNPYGGNWYSALSTFTLDQPAFWHCPDLFLGWYDNRFRRGDTYEWDVNRFATFAAGGFLHEYTHTFLPTVGHQNTCQNNIMHSSGNIDMHPRTSFTGCQSREIYRSLMARHVRKYVVCEDVLDASHEIVVDTDEEWQNDLRLYTNVRVKSGATLSIQCKLYLQPKTNIFVERGARLILDEDALIANGGVCEDVASNRWSGIRLEGNNAIPHKPQYAFESYTLAADDHGIVLLLPNSTVRDANNAIACKKEEETWNSNYWGGYIRADGVQFINNKRSIEYLLANFDSRSEILNSTFDGGQYGITSWRCDNVNIRGCTFNDQERSALYSINAGLQVQYNDFNGINDAIGIENTTLINHPYVIQRNDFTNNGLGINASVANNLLISNNDFAIGVFGVALMGEGQAVIQNNRFEQLSAGVDLQSAGSDPTPIGCNIFDECSFGVNASGDNLGMQYFNNQNSNNFDVYIQSDADNNPALIANQGSSLDRVVNAFTVGHTRHLHTEFNENVQFTYFPESGNPNDLSIPQCYIGDPDCIDPCNFQVNFGTFNGPPSFELCGDIGNQSTPEPPCDDCGWSEGFIGGGDDEVAIAAAIQSQITPATIAYKLSDAKLQKEFRALLQNYAFRDDYARLETYLNQFGDYFLPMKYSVAMQQGDWTKANMMLDQIGNYAGQESFVLPQRIYLSWVKDKDYVPTETERQSLNTYAALDDPRSAFSRSVLNIVYGEQFIPRLPDVPVEERSAIGSSESAAEENLEVYPNPFKELLLVNPGGAGVLRVVNVLGQVVLEKEVGDEEVVTFNTSHWAKGVYYVEFRYENNRVRVEKIMKQ
ncbi:MAG: T9SS type A sorting domain-containing protein [Bacteroidota bacterium]